MGGGQVKEHLLFVLPFEEPRDLISQLKEKLPDFDITYHHLIPGSPPSRSIWHTVTVVCTLTELPANPCQDAPHLQLVHLVSAGSNQLQSLPIYTDTDITITTSSGIHGPQIAEWAVMTALVASHHYHTLHHQQQHHIWPSPAAKARDYRSVHDRVGRRIGILGYGSIGRQVGRVARAMGMDVVAFTASPKTTPAARRDHGFIIPGTGDPEGDFPSAWFSGLDRPSLHEFLKQDLDWLLVAVPLTKQTNKFLGKDEFRVLKNGSGKEGEEREVYVTNIARGAILDQPALIEALKDGTLAGAALDVTDPEPLPADSELWDLKNVIVTPHISASGSTYFERAFTVLAENLERRRKGEPLLNVVQRDRGY